MQSAKLLEIYPNPAKTVMRVRYASSVNGPKELKIFDISGKLINIISLPTGKQESVWNLKTNDGKTVSSGVYFYMLKIENKTAFGKFIVQR
jgi:hypothetical protein